MLVLCVPWMRRVRFLLHTLQDASTAARSGHTRAAKLQRGAATAGYTHCKLFHADHVSHCTCKTRSLVHAYYLQQGNVQRSSNKLSRDAPHAQTGLKTAANTMRNKRWL